MKSLLCLIILNLSLAACAKPHPQNHGTILSNWGVYNNFPLEFERMKLNQPNVVQYDIGQGKNYLGTCGAIVNLNGTETSGELSATGGFVVYTPYPSGNFCPGELTAHYEVKGDQLTLSGYLGTLNFKEVTR